MEPKKTVAMQEVERLREILRNHGGHKFKCPEGEGHGICNCGWSVLRDTCLNDRHINSINDEHERFISGLHLLLFNIKHSWPVNTDKMGYLAVALFFHPNSSMAGTLGELFEVVGIEAPDYLTPESDVPISHGATVDFGMNWSDGLGYRYRVTWEEETGYLYAYCFGGPKKGSREVLAVVETKETAYHAMEGWEHVIQTPNSLFWARARGREYTEKELPAKELDLKGAIVKLFEGKGDCQEWSGSLMDLESALKEIGMTQTFPSNSMLYLHLMSIKTELMINHSLHLTVERHEFGQTFKIKKVKSELAMRDAMAQDELRGYQGQDVS